MPLTRRLRISLFQNPLSKDDFSPSLIFRMITSDNDYGLFSVTVFRKIAQDFKNVAREKKFAFVCFLFLHRRFIVREFEFVAEDIQAQKAEYSSLQSDLSKKQVRLVAANLTRQNAALAWCKTAFSESFSAWIHIKVALSRSNYNDRFCAFSWTPYCGTASPSTLRRS